MIWYDNNDTVLPLWCEYIRTFYAFPCAFEYLFWQFVIHNTLRQCSVLVLLCVSVILYKLGHSCFRKKWLQFIDFLVYTYVYLVSTVWTLLPLSVFHFHTVLVIPLEKRIIDDFFIFFFSSRRRHTRYIGDWSSDVCSSDLMQMQFYHRVILKSLDKGSKHNQ